MSLARRLRRQRKEAASEPLHLQADLRTIAIVTPTMDMMHTVFGISLVQMVAYTMNTVFAQQSGALNLTFLVHGTSILQLSRTELVKKGLEAGATDLLWIDSDMEFPPDMLLRLARHSEPIVAANCIARRPPYLLTARNEAGEQVYTNDHSSGLEKVARVGMGVMWTRMDVFRAIPQPWFDTEWVPELQSFRGEDFAFCEKAKAAGFPIYIDHDVSKDVKHVGQFGYSPLHKQAQQGETR